MKDAIEAMGVPHTEVDVILVNGRSVGFSYQLQDRDVIDVYPPTAGPSTELLRRLCHQPPEPVAFVADVHLGRLMRRLRLLGFDTLYRNDLSDAEILHSSFEEGRIILTRDRGILKHRRVEHGYLVRSDQVEAQVREVLQRYRLFARLQPWSRCLSCNGLLSAVAKAEVVQRLEPKTRLYYDTFQRCDSCDQLYWPGSHCAALKRWLAALSSDVADAGEQGR